MTFQQIYQAVQNIRFDSSILTTDGGIKQWITAREGEVWQFADWPIKESVQLNLTVTGGTATVALPTGMTWTAQAIDIYDNYGQKLNYLRPTEFYEIYSAAASSPQPSGYPESWTLVTDPTASGALVFRVGPTPVSSATFTVQGWNQPIKRTAASAWAIGTMSADTDLPWWPDAYHYFLVSGAIALGKRQLGDPTWQSDENDFQQGLQRLMKHELGDRQPLVQWGGDLCGGY